VKDGTSTFVLGQYLDSGHTTLSSYSGGTTVKGGTLQIPWDGAMGAASGSLTLDGGTVSVKAPDLQYDNPNTHETAITWTSNRPFTVTPNGGTIDTPTFNVQDAGSVTHALVASVLFNGNGGYQWGGVLNLSGAAASSFMLNGGTGNVSVSPAAAIHINAPVAMTIGGSTDPLTDSADTSRHLALQNDGALTIASGTKSAGAITGTGNTIVAIGASLSASHIVQTNVTINGNLSLHPGGANASKVATLTIAGAPNNWTGKLDLTNNALILTNVSPAEKTANLPAVQNQLLTGIAGGLYTGEGITSSTVLNTPNSALVLADNADLHYTSFRGQLLDDNALIIAQAHLGDANLDQKIDALDLNLLAAHWQQPAGAFWSAGDFNGDGKVDALDLNVLAGSWQTGLGGSVQAALAASPVPEPASLAVLALGATVLTFRRRRG